MEIVATGETDLKGHKMTSHPIHRSRDVQPYQNVLVKVNTKVKVNANVNAHHHMHAHSNVKKHVNADVVLDVYAMSWRITAYHRNHHGNANVNVMTTSCKCHVISM